MDSGGFLGVFLLILLFVAVGGWLIVRFVITSLSKASSKRKLEEVLAACRAETIALAQKRLGRALTEEERLGIESLNSVMMLESCYRSFESEKTSREQVAVDIAHLVEQARLR